MIGALAACADGEAAQRISSGVDVVDAAATSGTGSIADQGIFDQASALVCDTDRKTLMTAIEAFTAIEGRPPADESELIGTFLREASTAWDIAPDGTLVPAAGSTCT